MDPRKPDPGLYNVPFTTDSFRGMPYRHLGRSGLRVSAVGLGAWKFGYPETGDGSRVDEAAAFRVFDSAIELGVTFWDTANRYNAASGNSERVIGAWFRNNRDQRRNVVLASKCYGGMDGLTPNHGRLSRGNILDSVCASLQRLGLEYLDLLYFHSYDEVTPVEESLAAIDDLVRRDLVRYFAVSNFTPDQLKLYRAAEAEAGVRARVLAVQNQYDIVRGESPAHAGALEYCAREGVSFVAWSPLARGLLTDRYLDLKCVGPGDRLFDEGTLEKDSGAETMAKVRGLAEVAKEYGLTLSQLALAYMLSLPGMGPAIPSSSSVEQLRSNAAAGKVTLDAAQQEQVRSVLSG